jgi:hypothetical protein
MPCPLVPIAARTIRRGFEFCVYCTSPLREAEAVAVEERKIVSVPFCDVVGFTASSEQADPADVRARMRHSLAHSGNRTASMQGLRRTICSTLPCEHVSGGVSRRRGASRVPQRCPFCVRVFLMQTTSIPYLQGFSQADGLEPSTPSLPWKFETVTRVHARSFATRFCLQSARCRRVGCVARRRACRI